MPSVRQSTALQRGRVPQRTDYWDTWSAYQVTVSGILFVSFVLFFVVFILLCFVFEPITGLIVSRHFFKHKQQAAAAHGSSWSLGICYEKSWSRCGETFVYLLMIIWPVCCITKGTFTPTGQKFFAHTPLIAMPSPPPQPDLNYSKFIKKMYT